MLAESPDEILSYETMGDVADRNAEQVLVERSINGDGDAFRDLISPYWQRLYRKTLSITGSPDDAEDVVQDALISAFRSLPNFRGESGIYTYLYRIVVNRAITHVRKRAVSGNTPVDVSTINVQDERMEIPESMVMEEGARSLVDSLNQLQEKYRRILLMRYFEDLSYQEIAEILQLNEGTVKSRLNKAKELLKRQLVKDGKDEKYFGIVGIIINL